MWKYKNLMLIGIVSIILPIILDIVQGTHFQLDTITSKFLETGNVVIQMLCFYTLIIVLKKHHESFWLMLPIYLMIAGKLFITYAVPAIIKLLTNSTSGYSNYYTIVTSTTGLIFLVIFILLIISCFKIKNEFIAPYFKLYGWVTIGSISFVVGLNITKAFLTDARGYYNYLTEIIYLLPACATLWLLFNLYKKHEAYFPGNTIITLNELENIPIGTTGIIQKKHEGDYYEVEFLDDRGNLLNTLSVSSDDFEHTSSPDLEARVENFGQA